MTRYTVVGTPDALDELADLWIRSTDRNAVTAAVRVVDDELSQDAPLKGREVSEGLRKLVAPPLRVLFSVDDRRPIVQVDSVARS